MTTPAAPRSVDLPTPVPLDPTADLSTLDEAKVLAAPEDPTEWPAWRANLSRWRREARERVGYVGDRYDRRPPGPFLLAFAPLWDTALYDPRRHEFTVDGYLDRAERDFGGLDGVLLWHAYPVLGIDERHQLDFFRELHDLPDAVAAFQRRGVQV